MALDKVTTGVIADDAVSTDQIANNAAISTSGAIAGTGGLTIDGATVFNEASADVDFRVESNGNANMLVVDGGTDRVGIKTAVPTEDLHITGTDGSNSYLLIQNDASPESVQKFGYENNNGGFINLQNESGTDSVRFRSYGNSFTLNNFGIGTTAPAALLEVSASSGEGIARITAASGENAYLDFYDTTSFNCRIGSHASGHLLFMTNGANERMRIDDGGEVGIGRSPVANKTLCISGLTGNTSDQILNLANSSDAEQLYVTEGGYGWINAASWNYSSDIKLKENIVYLESTLDKINSLKPCSFDYIDGSKSNLGFIAQDVQVVVPEAISNSAQEGEEELLGMKTNFIIPLLTKAIQELSAKVTALESA